MASAERETCTLAPSLAQHMVQTRYTRPEVLHKAPQTDALFRDCVKYHIINEAKEMPFLRWDPASKRLMPTKDKGLPAEEVLHMFKNITMLMQDPEITLRCHSLKKLHEDKVPSTALPWLWIMSARHNSELWHQVRKLSFHSCWQLIQARVKPQMNQRSPLSQLVQKEPR